MRLAAIVAVGLIGVVCLFQLALAFGAPWGSAAFGGQHRGTLPRRLRWASGIAGLVIYPLIIVLVLTAADLREADRAPQPGRIGMWILTGLFALGAIANFASRSKVEHIWGPGSLVIAVCCGILATNV